MGRSPSARDQRSHSKAQASSRDCSATSPLSNSQRRPNHSPPRRLRPSPLLHLRHIRSRRPLLRPNQPPKAPANSRGSSVHPDNRQAPRRSPRRPQPHRRLPQPPPSEPPPLPPAPPSARQRHKPALRSPPPLRKRPHRSAHRPRKPPHPSRPHLRPRPRRRTERHPKRPRPSVPRRLHRPLRRLPRATAKWRSSSGSSAPLAANRFPAKNPRSVRWSAKVPCPPGRRGRTSLRPSNPTLRGHPHNSPIPHRPPTHPQ